MLDTPRGRASSGSIRPARARSSEVLAGRGFPEPLGPLPKAAAVAREQRMTTVEVAMSYVRLKELESATRVEIQRLKEEGATARCSLTEEGRTRRLERIAEVAEIAVAEKHRTERQRIDISAGTEREAIAARSRIEVTRLQSRQELLNLGPWLCASLLGAFGNAVPSGAAGIPRTRGGGVARYAKTLAVIVILRKIWRAATHPQASPVALVLRQSWRPLLAQLLHRATQLSSSMEASGHSAQHSAPKISPGSPVPVASAASSSAAAGGESAPKSPLAGRSHSVSPKAAAFSLRGKDAVCGFAGGIPGGSAASPERSSPSKACGRDSVDKALEAVLKKSGLSTYAEPLARLGYDAEVLGMLRAQEEVDEMLDLIQCKPGHRVKFRVALESWRSERATCPATESQSSEGTGPTESKECALLRF